MVAICLMAFFRPFRAIKFLLWAIASIYEQYYPFIILKLLAQLINSKSTSVVGRSIKNNEIAHNNYNKLWMQVSLEIAQSVLQISDHLVLFLGHLARLSPFKGTVAWDVFCPIRSGLERWFGIWIFFLVLVQNLPRFSIYGKKFLSYSLIRLNALSIFSVLAKILLA